MFANQIKKLCDGYGESLRQLALAIGVDPSTASGWNRGAIPRKSTLKKIADHFGVTMADNGKKWHFIVDSIGGKK